MEQASSSDDEDNVNWAAGDAAGDSSDGEPALDEDDEAEERAPPPQEPAPPKKKKRRRSKQETEAARLKTRRRKLEHEAAVAYFLARLRLLSRWCDDPVARDAAEACVPGRAWRNMREATEGDCVGAVTAVMHACRSTLLRGLKPGTKLGLAPASLARAALANPSEKDEGAAAMLLVAALRGCGVDARLVGQLDVHTKGKARGELWCEARVGRRFVFLDAAAGTCVLSSEQLTRTRLKPRAYIMACDANGSLYDVGVNYNARGAPAFSREWLRDALRDINAASSSNPWRAPAPDTLPTSIGAFRTHHAFALRSQLLRRERLRGSAQPVATFRGEPVFARKDVETLRTKADWARHARRVKDNQQPRGALGGSQEDADPVVQQGNVALDVAEGRAVGLYGEDQTEPLVLPTLDEGFPTNEQGDVEILNGDEKRVPPGATWVKGQDASKACASVGVECAPVLVGFDRRRGSTRPRKDGVLVRDEDADKVVEELRRVRAVAKRKSLSQKRSKVHQRWAVLARGLLSRDVLRERYGA